MRRPPRPSLAKLARAGGVLALALLVFGAGVMVGGHPLATGLTRLPDELREVVLGESGQDLPGRVLELLEEHYYRDIDAEALEQASVEAIVASLDDRYTTYLDPQELAALRAHREGTYPGVGLRVAARDGDVVVTRVFPDTPAAAADIGQGDRIVSVDGRPSAGRTLTAVVESVRGPEGTTVTLGIDPRGDDAAVREVELRRARIPLDVVRGELRRAPGGAQVGHVRLLQFTRDAGDALREEVERLRERGAQALVLDLRGNPGGLVSEAIDVAGVFLDESASVVTTEGAHSPRTTLRTEEAPSAGDLPLVVLLDGGSASASEIVAGALRDHERARLVGAPTFGKALVQSTIPLRDGGALKLTTARYLTPDGHDVSESGIVPGVRATDDPETEVDEALRRALRVAAPGG